MTHLLIAGHGKRKNDTFDPGATGIISKGEHKYVKENLFPAMKKYVGDADVVFFDDYNVYDHGDIVTLAKKYGKDTKVTEIHYDAGGSDASGGHVIVYSGYAPDALDLRLRDAIKAMVGIRYNHKGHEGISGRNNLANVNRTQKAGINYRLVELGFGTNKKDADIMVNKVDEYAKKLVEALLNEKVEGKPVATPVNKPAAEPVKATPTKASKSIAQMAQEVIANKHGNGHDNRRKSLGISATEYEKVRAEVNRQAGVKTAPVKPKKTVEQMAKEIINNPKVPKGHTARQIWLGVDNATYQKVRARVNQLL